MKINTFWVVTEPNPDSVLVDICFSATLSGLANQARGDVDRVLNSKTTACYTEEAEAIKDAKARLRKRDAAKPMRK